MKFTFECFSNEPSVHMEFWINIIQCLGRENIKFHMSKLRPTHLRLDNSQRASVGYRLFFEIKASVGL